MYNGHSTHAHIITLELVGTTSLVYDKNLPMFSQLIHIAINRLANKTDVRKGSKIGSPYSLGAPFHSLAKPLTFYIF